jgi:hypothetical protein
MGTTIVIRNGSTLPSQGSGITLAEPAFNTDLRTFHIGLGHGTTAEWIGAPISGASGTIASAEAYKIPTAKAVKDYVTDYVTAVNGVLTVNGFAGGVTLTAGTGMSVAAANGTLTLTNVGVQSFNGATGAVQGVSSVQGRTGAIGICGGVGIAIPNAPTGTTFTVSLNYISGGTAMSARKTITKDDWLAFQDNTGLNPMYRAQVGNLSYLFLGTLTNRFDAGSNGTFLRISSALDDTNKASTDEYITVGNLFTAYGDYVSSFNGATGAVQGVSAAVAGTGISVSAATGAVTITNTGVQSFNGLTGAVQGVSAAVAGTGIFVSAATGSVTITNTGVQSFNGLTGAVGGVCAAQTNTFVPVQYFVGGLCSAAGITAESTVSSVGFSTISGYGSYRSMTTISSDTLKFAFDPDDDNSRQTLRPSDDIPDLAGSQIINRLPASSGILALTSQLMGAVNGSTAATTAVTSFNGLTGSVQGVSSAVAGTGISVSGATGAVTITNTGVQSFNGNTGAVTGASLGANTFSGVNSFIVGISAEGITTGALTIRSGGASRYFDFVTGPNNQIIARGNTTLNLVQESHQSIYIGDFDAANNATYIEVDDSNQIIKFYFNGDYYTFPTASGTVGQVLGIDSANSLGWRSSVSSFNGASGTVGISAGSGISITQSGTTFTIASTASGGSKTYAVFTPLDNQPPASNFATLDTRNSIAVLDFDASTDESAVFVGVIPEGASLGSGLKIRISWMATSATSGACRWGVQIERMNTDEDSDSFDTAATGGSTTNGTSGIVTTTEITVTTIDSVAAGEPFRLKVFRDADGTSGTDDMTGDAELVAVEVRSAS